MKESIKPPVKREVVVSDYDPGTRELFLYIVSDTAINTLSEYCYIHDGSRGKKVAIVFPNYELMDVLVFIRDKFRGSCDNFDFSKHDKSID